MGVGRDYSNWIKDRISKYDFKENQDFIVFANSGENPQGGRPTIEYALSLDMAKEVCMVENNEKGRIARRYFIEVEKRYRARKPALSQEDKTARALAPTTLRALARCKAYPQERQATFLAEAAHVLSGQPIERYLPVVVDNRANWQSPTMLAEQLGITPNKLGRLLKEHGLHADSDPEHSWSLTIWNKASHCDKQVMSNLYDPAILLPRLRALLGH